MAFQQQSNTEHLAPFNVKGKSAIVTGAGSGINFSFTSLLLSRGCSVLLADLTLRPEASALLSQYPSSNTSGPRALFCKTDVTSWPDLTTMFNTAISAFGSVDIVCPGAGVYDPHWTNFWHPPGSSKSRDAVDGGRYASLDINVTHPIRVSQMAISHFLNPPEGVAKAGPKNPKRVVLISSIAAQNANLLTPIYVASKHAISGFIRSLAALEPEFGIRVNGVAPGIIKTPLWTEHPEKMTFLDEEKDAWATPEEVAEAMRRCLEDADVGGGKVVEVGAGQTRFVEALMDPGPSGKGHTASNGLKQYEEVYECLGEEGWGVDKKA
ncbi:hypothetical protein DE146DRAFT_662398 [Phaeosphaeria sp. MPI-PUGE-AT-0046c]|nr:hypothetical protein DE146DRAFT_662398 [Phaeosphaeria sp. MPI-PUGE-AT-0046c]